MIIAEHADRAGLGWRLLLGFAYVLVGVYLIASPVPALVSRTLVLALLFLFEGIFDIAMFFRLRAGGSIWVLLNGIVTLTLGLMIYLQWPSTAGWVIGMLVGAGLVVSGITRIMLTLAARKGRDASLGGEIGMIHRWRNIGRSTVEQAAESQRDIVWFPQRKQVDHR